MRLIDVDKYFSGMTVQREMIDKIYKTFGVDITVNNISIDWMRKELIEMLYDREIDEKTLKAFTKLIARWGIFNEHTRGD